MPRFEPFPALRYAPGSNLDEVIVPPYDVLSADDRAQLAARSPHNFVHVDVPVETDGDERYEAAATTLRGWIDSGVMTVDERPSFTIYRMTFVDESGTTRTTVGVVGALEVVDEGAGGVLPHERTTPKAKTDRLDLTRATSVNLSPVWGLSLAAGLTELLEAPGEACGELVVDGVTHRVERVDDPARVAAISAAVGAAPVVIADGHHRYAISRTFRDEVRAASGSNSTDAELTMTYVGELIEDQLSIAAIHRLYSGTTFAALRAQLAESFELQAAGPVDPTFAQQVVSEGSLCLVDANGDGTWLRPIAARFDGERNLDGARLERALADFDHDVTYQHGVDHVVAAVQAGEAGVLAGVLIRPVGIDEIRRTADEGLLMPPKSTFFTPKLRSGLVSRPLAI